MRRDSSLGLVFALVVLNAATSDAGIFYSGVRNLTLQGTPGSQELLGIDLADDTVGTWDNLQFEITLGVSGSLGTSTSFPSSPAVLAYESEFPLVENYAFGSTLTGSFGSGSFSLWRFDSTADTGFFRDTSGFAGLMLGDFLGSKHFGWVQLEVSDYKGASGSAPSIKVVDWAFERTPNKAIRMGQIPEPSSLYLLGAGVLGLVEYAWRRLHSRTA